MCRFLSLQTWFVVSLIWSAAMFYLCYASWPQVPLDISATDPATVSAMRNALLRHSLFYGLLAAGPPLIALALGRMLCGRDAARG